MRPGPGSVRRAAARVRAGPRPEHPDTLVARDESAFGTGKAGDPAAARDQLAALLPVRERVLGPEHPDTLDTRYDLAYWVREADGDPDAAEN